MSLRHFFYIFPSPLATITNKTVNTDGPVHTTTDQLAVTKSNTVDRSFMACERALMLPRPWIPNLDGLVFGARDEAQAIGRK